MNGFSKTLPSAFKKLVGVSDAPEALYTFNQGASYEAYKFFGAHRVLHKLTLGVVFRVFARCAAHVYLLGDFNGWNTTTHELQQHGDSGIYELFVPYMPSESCYKFRIISPDGNVKLRPDPFAFCSRHDEQHGTVSVVHPLKRYRWGDITWMYEQVEEPIQNRPLSIYEIHTTSWRRNDDGSAYDYRELADVMVPYVAEMGFTHISLMPQTFCAKGDNYGYKVHGLFSTSGAHGQPEDFIYFVDKAHSLNVGVIVDMPLLSFPKEDDGLFMFDGGYAFESENSFLRERPDSDCVQFDFAKPAVQNFLISAAVYWMEVFHIDGIKINNLTSVLYRDYGRGEGMWERNAFGGRENLEAFEFFQKFNDELKRRNPGFITIAQEEVPWPAVTGPINEGGLGFTLCNNYGWTTDMMEYMSTDPFFRRNCHQKVTFSIYYAFSERFLLGLGQADMSENIGSLINSMPGEYEAKFANLRTLFGYMIAHPGKNQMFMGCEFGQFKEWSPESALNWMLLDYDSHMQLQRYIKYLNNFYRASPELYELDFKTKGFCWGIMDDSEQNIVAFFRFDSRGDELLCISNFAPVQREDYSIGVEKEGTYEEVFSSNELCFGGTGVKNDGLLKTLQGAMHGKNHHITVTIPPLTSLYLRRIKMEE